ncbi:MAG TPA: transcriptional regulator [Alcanivorax sp.]|nr:transcriptional regulator [Alcanivorax sp.]
MAGFHERLKAARQALGMTQEALAEELNVTKASVSAWENDREKPGFRLLAKIRDVLGVSLDDLVCGAETEEAPANDPQRVARNDDEAALLKAYRKLPAKRRQALLNLLG